MNKLIPALVMSFLLSLHFVTAVNDELNIIYGGGKELVVSDDYSFAYGLVVRNKKQEVPGLMDMLIEKNIVMNSLFGVNEQTLLLQGVDGQRFVTIRVFVDGELVNEYSEELLFSGGEAFLSININDYISRWEVNNHFLRIEACSEGECISKELIIATSWLRIIFVTLAFLVYSIIVVSSNWWRRSWRSDAHA